MTGEYDGLDTIKIILRLRRIRRTVDDLRRAPSTAIATSVVDRSWSVLTRRWTVRDVGGLDGLADRSEDLARRVHQLVLGDPTIAAGGMPGPLAAAVDGVAEAVPLPGDRRVKAVVRLLRVTAIVVGFGTGHAVLAGAAVKSLVRSEVTNLLAETIQHELRPVSHRRVRARPGAARPGGDARPGPDRRQQARPGAPIRTVPRPAPVPPASQQPAVRPVKAVSKPARPRTPAHEPGAGAGRGRRHRGPRRPRLGF